MNLATTHPSHKLAAKRHGPFRVTAVISPVVYRLKIPKQWKQQHLHDVFHANLLPITQYIHNTWPNSTTKKAPFKLIMGHVPSTHQSACPSQLPTIQSRIEKIKEARSTAQEAIVKVQQLLVKNRAGKRMYQPFTLGEKV